MKVAGSEWHEGRNWWHDDNIFILGQIILLTWVKVKFGSGLVPSYYTIITMSCRERTIKYNAFFVTNNQAKIIFCTNQNYATNGFTEWLSLQLQRPHENRHNGRKEKTTVDDEIQPFDLRCHLKYAGQTSCFLMTKSHWVFLNCSLQENFHACVQSPWKYG